MGVWRKLRAVSTTTTLNRARKDRGLSLAAVSEAVGTDPSNLWRIELGRQLPSRELARKLFKFFGGAVELGAIYDPNFSRKNSAKTAATA